MFIPALQVKIYGGLQADSYINPKRFVYLVLFSNLSLASETGGKTRQPKVSTKSEEQNVSLVIKS